MQEEGYTQIQAKYEAARCLMCADAPCVCECPAGVDARAFIRKIRFDNLDGAVRMLKRQNVLAGSCARICPTGTLCGKGCVAKGLSRPIDIGGLQRYVMDWEIKVGMIEPECAPSNGLRIAVVGSGPAGVGVAAELAIRGYKVTVYEKETATGGMLRQCIPSFRLPEKVLDFELEFFKKLGIEFICDHEIKDPKELFKEDYKAVFISTGLTAPKGSDIIGRELAGVYQAIRFLEDAKGGKMPPLGKRVVVIGGGDTAIDAARVSKRAGSECTIIYRRTQREMPAYPNEVDEAWDEGIEFLFRGIVRSIVGDEKVKGVRCVKIRWHDHVRGMPQAYDIEGSEFLIACDNVIIATGQGPASTFGLRTTPNGLIATDKDTMMTSEPGIFAGGDVVFGGSTASRAVGMGRRAAAKIDEYLKK